MQISSQLDLQDGAASGGVITYNAQTFVREALQVKITPMM